MWGGRSPPTSFGPKWGGNASLPSSTPPSPARYAHGKNLPLSRATTSADEDEIGVLSLVRLFLV